jgi:hypothetical protein
VITLGSEGEQLVVIIPVGADFLTTLSASTPWPTGTIIELHLSNTLADVPVVWSAVVSDSTAVFDVSKADTQPVADARLSLARLFYSPGGSGMLLWAHGTTRFV